VKVCKLIGRTSIAFTVTGFRAQHPGAAIISAPLAPGWYGAYKPGPGPARDSITVR
jgi:hypothetical protein